MPLGLEDWKVEVFKILGQKIEQRRQQPVVPLAPRERVDAGLIASDEPIVGKRAPVTPIERFFANCTFGDHAGRHDEELSQEEEKKLQARRKRNQKQKDVGTAADVSFKGIGSHARIDLKGTFYAGGDYNLKDNEYRPDTSRPVVLFLSGSGGSAEHYGTDIAEQYQQLGASVLTCDYAGFGRSEDTDVGEKGLYEDAQAMLEYLVSLGYRTEDIVIHGYSLGGAIAGNLEDRNESLGNRFRGVVFDRPMTSLKEATIAHKGKYIGGAAGQWAKSDIGSMSLKKALDRMQTRDDEDELISPIGGRLMTSDNEGLGDKAHALREARGLGGADTDAGHGDHEEMFDAHREMFQQMLFPDDELPEDRDRDWIETQGTAMVTPSPTVSELRALFLQTFNDVQDWSARIKTLATSGLPGEAELADGSWKAECVHCLQLVERVIDTVHDLERTGLLETSDFAEEAAALLGFSVRAEGYGRSIKKNLLNQGQFDPSLDAGEMGRTMQKVAVLMVEFDRAGGASSARRTLEDKVLNIDSKLNDFEALGAFLMAPPATTEERLRQDDWLFQYELLQDAVLEIHTRRQAAEQRRESVREATERINQNLRSRPAEDVTPLVRREMSQRAADGLVALLAADEDVRRKKLIGHSSDKGYKQRVTDPVNALQPLLQKIAQGDPLTRQELDQLETLREQLLAARTHYFNAWNGMSDRKKDTSEGRQRRAKYQAIDNRLRGLGQLIDLARSRDQVVLEMEELRGPQVEQELRAAGVFDDFARQLTTFTADDPDEIKDLARMLQGLDPLTRGVLLKQNNPPKGLARVLTEVARLDSRLTDPVTAEIIKGHADDDDSEYMHSLITEVIDQEVKSQQPTTLFRKNSLSSRLCRGFNAAGTGQPYATAAISRGLNAINALDRTWEMDTNRLEPGDDVDASFVHHHETFDVLFGEVCQTQIPEDVSRVCAALYDSVLRQFGPPQLPAEEAEAIARRAASAHLFLRIVNPALITQAAATTDSEGRELNPDVSARQYRNGLIQSKILQAIANEQPFGEKEKWLVPFNITYQDHADRFQDLMARVVREGRTANGSDAQPAPLQVNPRSRQPDDNKVVQRLKQCVTPNDLLFELSALEIDQELRFGFSTDALAEKYRDARERVQDLQAGQFSDTSAAIGDLLRLVRRADDPGVRQVLADKLVRPLAESFEEQMDTTQSGWRLQEVQALFATPEQFLRTVARAPVRLAELMGVDRSLLRAMAQATAVVHNRTAGESERSAAIQRLDSFLEQTVHAPTKRYCASVLRP